jgi:alpha-amylase
LFEWINKLVNKYDFDAIRVDAIVHVPKEFMGDFSKAAGVFQMGEVLKE